MPEMTHADIARLHEQLGMVLANQATAARDIAELKEDSRRSTEQSSVDRRNIKDGVDDLNERTSHLEMRMDQFAKDMDDNVMPTIKKVQDWEKVGIGAIAATGMIASGISAAVTFVILRWQSVVDFFRNL